MTFTINLLGGLSVTRNGQPITLPTRKAGALLAYLACHPDRAIPRVRLADMLWPDSDKAVANLRAELVRLRKAIDNDDTHLLTIHRTSITLHAALAQIDTQHIQQLLDMCDSHAHPDARGCQDCCVLLAQASDLYHAPVLEGFSIKESPEFENWLDSFQETYQKRIISALEILQIHLADLGRHLLVAKYARRHLAFSPWLEEPLIRLMKALIQTGARDEAIESYKSVRELLRKEFGTEPTLAATQVYDAIRSQRMTEPARPATKDSPYPGLAAFGTNDAPNFHGRESIVERLAQAVGQQPLVLLAGPSGSGKSSLVQAGLIPHLRGPNSDETQEWTIIIMRPRRNPLINLARTLGLPPNPEDAAAQIAAALSNKSLSLRQIVRQALHREEATPHKKKRILLIIDQFEEIFTLCKDEAVRRLFLAEILAKPNKLEQDETVSLLIVLRADFLGQALGHRSFSKIAEEPVLFLGIMTDQELRRAMEEPARHNGIEYEPGLIDRILNDLEDSPGQLPLLQFSLALLWERRTDHWITNEAYDEIERVSGALTHYADGIYQQLSPDEKESARRVLLQLVHPGEGVEDARRLASRAEIGDEDWPLVHKLANARLVVTNQLSGMETVEVIHETLIQKWPRLRDWLEEDRAFRLWLNRARNALRSWQAANTENEALLRGLALAEAERWLTGRGDELEENLVNFIERSLQERAWREESERRHSENLSRALEESRRMERRALARQLGAQADQLMQRKSDLALLLSNVALQISDLAQDRTDLLTSLEINPYLEKILHGHDAPVFHVSFGVDDKTIISFDQRNTIQIWQTDSYTPKILCMGNHGPNRGIAVDATGRWIATLHDEQIALWEIADLSTRVLVPGCKTTILGMTFSVDGRYLVAVAQDGELGIWDTKTGERLTDVAPIAANSALQTGPNADFLVVTKEYGGQSGLYLRSRQSDAPIGAPLLGHTGGIHGIALSSDGSRLSTASFDGTARLWDTKTGQPVAPALRGHSGRVLSANFSPDGRLLATGGTDNLLLLWDGQSGERLDIPPFRHSNWVRCADFSADGGTLISGDSAGKIYIWNLKRRRQFLGHQKLIRSVTLSADGQMLATASFDGTVGLWDTASHKRLRTLSTTENTAEMLVGRFSPDGQTLAAADGRGNLYLWDTQSWQRRPAGENRHNEPSIALAFSPDGRLLAQGDMNGYVSLWDALTGEMLRPPTRLHTGSESWVLCLAFSPNGATLTTGCKNSTIGFWTVPGLAPARPPIQAHANWVTYLLYTGDGQTLISTSSDSTVRFWNPQTGEECAPPLIGHTGQVWQAAFSPVDGERVLITLGADGGVIWWDLESRIPLAPTLRTGVETESMAIALDGKYIYLGSFDNKAHAWEILQEDWQEHCLQIANRSLTEDEWKLYLGESNYSGQETDSGNQLKVV